MKQEKIVLFFWLFLCLYFGIGAWRLGLGVVRMPGSGFLPFWVSVIVFVLTLVQLFRTKIVREVQPFFHGKRIRNTVYALGLLFGYAVLFEKIGFFLCTFLFTGTCLKVIGGKRWLLVIGVSLFVAVFWYVLFVVWLQCQFPMGRWVEPILAWAGGLLWR